MKRSTKPTQEHSARRDLFAELSEGMDALAEARNSKQTLRTHTMQLQGGNETGVLATDDTDERTI